MINMLGNDHLRFLKKLTVLIICYSLMSPLAAQTFNASIPITRSQVLITNNSDEKIMVHSTLTTLDTTFMRGQYWDEHSLIVNPFETRDVLWFSRNQHIKMNTDYQFNVLINHPNVLEEQLLFKFIERRKSLASTNMVIQLQRPQETVLTILKKPGIESYDSYFWRASYKVYVRDWMPIGQLSNHYHIVIDKVKEHFYETKSNKKISILSYNTQLMPFYTGVVNHLNQPEQRAKDIPKVISTFDVVILEELFDNCLRKTVINLMQHTYPFHTQVVGAHSSKLLTGGVMIFSRWPILKEDQVIYHVGVGFDWFSAKGAVYAAIDKEGEIYHIIGTHLQAAGENKGSLIRLKQLVELNYFIERLNLPPDQPLLIGGDFNISQFNQEIDTLLTILHVNLLKNIGYPYSIDGKINTMTTNLHRDRIDYVFYSNRHLNPKMAFNEVFILRDLNNKVMWPHFDLSDHFPIVGVFEF